MGNMQRANKQENQTIECDLCGKSYKEHVSGKTIMVCYKDETEPYGTPIMLCDGCYGRVKASGIYKIKVLRNGGVSHA